MFEKTKEFAHNALTKGKLAVGSAVAVGSAAIMSVASFAEGTGFTAPTITVNASDFNGIMSQINAVFPAVLPVVVGCLAFRKGVSFMLGQIRGA